MMAIGPTNHRIIYEIYRPTNHRIIPDIYWPNQSSYHTAIGTTTSEKLHSQSIPILKLHENAKVP